MNLFILILALVLFQPSGQCGKSTVELSKCYMIFHSESGFRAAIILGHSDLQISKNAFAQSLVNSTFDFDSKTKIENK